MASTPHKDHGLAIIETAKDHLAAALELAPEDGWSIVEWADAAGLIISGANFPAVFAHHIAPVLVREGRAYAVEKGGLARYSLTAQKPAEQGISPMASATSAPQLWSSAPQEEVFVDGQFPEGEAEDEAEGEADPDGHDGPWIP